MCNKGMLQGQTFFVYESKLPKLMNDLCRFSESYFDCIILWCCIQHQIFVCVFFNVRVMQWQDINICLLLKVCMNLDFFLIAINNYKICLWVFECQHIKNWNVASCKKKKFWNVIGYHIQCLGSSLISMFIDLFSLHILLSFLNLIPLVFKSWMLWMFCMFSKT